MAINTYDIIISGGGAAGFFSAINIAEKHPGTNILILEKSTKCLDKVRISGGGRCNVTHACWEPKELIKFYPRGSKELLGPFHKFMCGDMLAWLDAQGIETNIEEDGRIFPSSNSSQTIIDCFMGQAQKHKITICLSEGMKDFERRDGQFKIQTSQNRTLISDQLIIATGGTKSIWKLLEAKGLKIIPPVPSLFTFNIKHPLLEGLPGVSIPSGRVRIEGFKMETTGPILITHWGLSGPGILKLSSWAARFLNERQYDYSVFINWVDLPKGRVSEILSTRKKEKGNQNILLDRTFSIPKRLWKKMILHLGLEHKNWADITKKEMDRLETLLCHCRFEAKGKSTNKDEFVTSGGIELKEINFKNMQSKTIDQLYFAGEVLNIDALTGGFNFQAAWTTAWIISEEIFNY